MENIHNHENITEIRCTANSPDFTYSVGAKIYTDSGQTDKLNSAGMYTIF